MTAADQPPAELVEKAARAIHDRICDCPDYGNGCGRWPTEDAEHVLAAVWPLVQAMIRDAKIETLATVRKAFEDAQYAYIETIGVFDVLAELRREVTS